MNKLSLIFALLIICIGCTQQLTSDEIRLKLIQANSQLQSYSSDTQMSMTVSTEDDGQQMTIEMDAQLKGDIDRVNKRLAMKGTVSSRGSGMDMTLDSETYIADNMLYTKVMDSWMKAELRQDAWDSQDQLQQSIALAQSGTVERLDDESMNGKTFYVIKMNPDPATLAELALKQQDLEIGGTNIGEMIKDYTVTVWVNKETFIIEKSSMKMRMELTPESMGKDGSEGSTVQMELDATTAISNINQPMDITVPAEALAANDIGED